MIFISVYHHNMNIFILEIKKAMYCSFGLCVSYHVKLIVSNYGSHIFYRVL